MTKKAWDPRCSLKRLNASARGKAKIVRRADPGNIPAPVMPAVLILKDNKACVLLSLSGEMAEVVWPEDGARRNIPRAELKKLYAGYAIFVHPRPEFADPEAPHARDAARHWFWGTVLENIGLYRKVILAAFLINIFGLTSSIYIMNVYNRVIPSNATETGWVLGLGALTVFIFDFIMRTLRAYFIDIAGRRIDVVVSRRIYDQLLDMKLAGKPASGGAFANMLREFDSGA